MARINVELTDSQLQELEEDGWLKIVIVRQRQKDGLIKYFAEVVK